MNRRAFVAGSVALFAPGAAVAQTANPVRQVGWLAYARQPRLQAAFLSGMRELGHVEGSSYTLVERYAEWNSNKLPPLAADLVRLKLDVIVAETLAAARAIQHATRTIPIVFITGDPVASGLAQSLARPGGNLTGVANLSLELYPKRVEVLKAAWSAPHFDCSPWGRKMQREAPWANTGGRQTADASSARSSSGRPSNES